MWIGWRIRAVCAPRSFSTSFALFAATLVSADAGNIHLWNAEGGKEVRSVKTVLVLTTILF
jgi:hypothetical protein